MAGLCWHDIKIVATLSGIKLTPYFLYYTVTWTLASGLIHSTTPFFLHSSNLRINLPQRLWESGINYSVSSVAYPIINPWSPAPICYYDLLIWTDWAIYGDCLSIATIIVAVLLSMPTDMSVYPISLIAWRAICSKLT
jgi:hypothetical protein